MSQFILQVEWFDAAVKGLPEMIGPFKDSDEAKQYAQRNVTNGAWKVKTLLDPYYRAPEAEE